MTTHDSIRTVLIDGAYWYVSGGWKHPAVMGGEGPTDPQPNPQPQPAPQPSPQPTPPAAETVSKAEAERLAKEARKDAEKALLATFGEGVTAEQVKAILDKQKADEDSRKDDATRAREAADAEKAAASTEREAARRERQAIKVQRALLAANVKHDRLDSASRLVTVADDADDETIKAAAEKFKTETPEWFPAPGQPPAPSGLPGTGQPPVQNQPDDLAAARERGKSWRERRNGAPENPFAGFRKIG